MGARAFTAFELQIIFLVSIFKIKSYFGLEVLRFEWKIYKITNSNLFHCEKHMKAPGSSELERREII